MGRPLDKHIDNRELNALVPSPYENGHGLQELSPDEVREAEHHVHSCADCSSKVSKYWLLVDPVANRVVSKDAPPSSSCPRDEDVDWYEVGAGLWPELKAKQLIAHAALCDHCGLLLRAAASVDMEPTLQEERMLAELAAPFAAPGESRAGIASRNRAVAWVAWASVMERLCACSGFGLALWIVNGDAPVIVETTFRAGICRLRGHHSPAARRRKTSA